MNQMEQWLKDWKAKSKKYKEKEKEQKIFLMKSPTLIWVVRKAIVIIK